jgi:hypothetical protein
MRTTDRSSDALQDLRQRFESAGLPLPPIPAVLEADMRIIGPWTWGTEADPSPAYDFAVHEQQAIESGADRLLIAHAGHGVNSWALHYYLTVDPVSVIVQVPYGGAHDDADRAVATVGRRFEEIVGLLGSAATATRAGRFEDGTRLVVARSDWHGGRVVVVGPEGEGEELEPSGDPFAAASAWLST